MPDYLTDPRLTKVPFMQLKNYVKEKNPSLSEELFLCSTKFSIVNVAEKHSVSLDALLDQQGPYVAPVEKKASPAKDTAAEDMAAKAAAEKAAAEKAAAEKAAAEKAAVENAAAEKAAAAHAVLTLMLSADTVEELRWACLLIPCT